MVDWLKNFSKPNAEGTNPLKSFKLPEAKVSSKVEEIIANIDFNEALETKNIDFNEPLFKYTPAVGQQFASNEMYCYDTIAGKKANWWENEKSIIHHDSLLASAYYALVRAARNPDHMLTYRKDLSVGRDKLLIGDSGGFQRRTLKDRPGHSEVIKGLTPEWVIQWEMANTDIGLVLDQPPYTDDRFRKSMKNFQASLDFTMNSSKVMSDLIQHDFPLYGVLQGLDYPSISKWYDGMKIYEDHFSGWACVPTPKNDPLKTAQFLAFAIEKDLDKPLHFLAISGMNTLPLLVYMSRKDKNGDPYYPHLITADSSSYHAGSMYRRYLVPNDYNFYLILGRDADTIDEETGEVLLEANEKASTIKNLPCDCPICSNHTVEDMRAMGNHAGMLVSLHNLKHYLKFVDILNALVDDPPRFREFVKRLSVRSGASDDDLNKTLLAMDYIDKMVERKGAFSATSNWQNIINNTKSLDSCFTKA